MKTTLQAPEIFASIPYDKSCDLWSIGVITYILYANKQKQQQKLFSWNSKQNLFSLTGLFPFADKSPMKLYEKITNVEYNWDECPDVSPHGIQFQCRKKKKI